MTAPKNIWIGGAAAALGAVLLTCPSLRGFTGAARRSPTAWESQIGALEARDKAQPPPENAILFVGSSSIRFWKDIQQDFPRYPVIQKGFGGAVIADVTYFADRIVLPYQPRMIVFYAGDNDIAYHHDPEKVLNDFKEFAKIVHLKLPATRIGFVSIKPSLARWSLLQKIRQANRLVKQFAKEEPRVSFIDIFTPMLDGEGNLKTDLLARDGLHLSRKGYRLWAKVITPNLPPLAIQSNSNKPPSSKR